MNAKEKILLASSMVKKASKDYKLNRFRVALRFLMAHLKGFSPVEISENDLLNLNECNSSLSNHVSNHALNKLQKKLNPVEYYDDTEDKVRFETLCQEHSLPGPKRAFELKFSNRSSNNKTSNPEIYRKIQEMFAVLQSGDYILKPAYGCHGQGVVPFTYSPGNNANYELGKFIEKHLSNFSYNKWIVEERLSNHSRVLCISPARALQTARVVTLTQGGDLVKVIAAQWRLAGTNSITDNFCYGSGTGVLCNIVPSTGIIEECYMGKKYPDEFGLNKITKHPETGKSLIGETVPMWNEIVNLTKRAAISFLPTRAIGWDVAITPDGPLLIEANRYWDPHNEDGRMGDRVNLLKRSLKCIE